MRRTGEVAKCLECKRWHLTAEGCSNCKQTKTKTDSGIIFVSDEDTAPLIKEMLSRATDSVMIASPWIWGIEDIVQRFEMLRKEKVDIAIFTRRFGERDREHERTVTEIRGFGCLVDFIDELHAKIVLVDDTELYIGSANLVGTSMERNKEAGIWTNNPSTVSEAKDYLADAFAEAFRARSRKES